MGLKLALYQQVWVGGSKGSWQIHEPFVKNFDFWDTYQIDLYDGRLFYTNDVRDLFELYISILSKSLTPKEEDGNPLYVESYYCVEDKTTAVDIKRQRQIDKADILYKFMDMMKGSEEEKQNMYNLLLYLDIIKSVDLGGRRIIKK